MWFIVSSYCIAVSTDFTITPLPVQAWAFLNSLGSIQPVTQNYLQVLSTYNYHPACSQVPIYTWSKELWRICSVPLCHGWVRTHNLARTSPTPYPLGHGTHTFYYKMEVIYKSHTISQFRFADHEHVLIRLEKWDDDSVIFRSLISRTFTIK